MNRRPLLLCGICALFAVCIALVPVFCAAAAPAEEMSSVPPTPRTTGAGSAFPYLLGTGVLLGMIVAVRLRRKADHDPARRRGTKKRS